jgi:hypothetical protein
MPQKLKSFAPEHLADDATKSGFFQCQKCGLIWFGKPERAKTCPDGPHQPRGRPVHVAVMCRSCDALVPLDCMVEHLKSWTHRECDARKG